MKGCALLPIVKKWGLTFFLIALLLFAITSTVNAAPRMMGDVNGDGLIDVRDATLVMQHVLNLRTLTFSQRELADVNGDGVINVADVNLITQRALGMISRFPVQDFHTVTFRGNGGYPSQQTRSVSHGGTIGATFDSMPTQPTLSGYTFSGWNTRVDGTGTWFRANTRVYSSQTVYAQWEPTTATHTVTFIGNGGLPTQQTRTLRHGETLGTMPGAMPAAPTRFGYTFMGWNTRVDGTGSWFTAHTRVYNSQTVYAQWRSTHAVHTLSFSGNGGIPTLQTRTVSHGGTIGTMPGAMPATPTRFGYTFMGWNTRVDGTGSWFTATTKVFSNMTLYAQWQHYGSYHTVSFLGNGGTPALQTRTVSYGGTLGTMPGAMPTPPSRFGDTFMGWNTRADGTGSWFTATTAVFSNMTVYAQWQHFDYYHTVTFMGSGGSPAMQSRTVSHGDSLGTIPGAMPSPPILLGAQFMGWNTRADGTGSWFSAMTPVYSNMTVYAQWQMLTATHTVTFNGNGGLPASQQKTVSHGESLGTAPGAMPIDPTRFGYNFLGWFTYDSGTGGWFTHQTRVYGNITVYALWGD